MKAVYWFTKAAEQGYAAAQQTIKEILQENESTEEFNFDDFDI